MNAIWAIFYRDYRQRMTNIGFMFWDIFAPVAYLLLFGIGFEKAMGGGINFEGGSVDYTAFLLPGVLAMTTFSVAMNTSWTFFMDKDSGIFYEILTYPITRRQFLIGKICFNVLLSTLGSLLTITLAVTTLGVSIHWQMLPLTIAGVMVTTAGWFFMFSMFSIRMNRMDSFNTFTSVSYILFMFLSSMFYPISSALPAWFRWVARVNPMTWQVDLLRYSILGSGEPTMIAVQSLGFIAFTLICLTLSIRELNRAG